MLKAASNGLPDAVARLDWDALATAMDSNGYATTGPLLPAADCAALIACDRDDALFRRRVVMERHGYGRGAYGYFGYPLPPLVGAMRAALYPPLAALANRWNIRLGIDRQFPDTLDAYTAQCHAAGQTRPTPLLLRYGPGDYNRMHQDIYGDEVFPIQAVFLLSRPGDDFAGGEFILTEQRPRMRARAEVVPLIQGEAVFFPVRQRPAEGKRGFHRVAMRHGVSRLRSGSRYTLGIIFHDAA